MSAIINNNLEQEHMPDAVKIPLTVFCFAIRQMI